VQQSPAASLAQFFRPSADSFPEAPCYLRADEKRAQVYRAQLNLAPGERLVGISWISRNAAIGAHKSSDLSAWSDVLQTPGVRFVNLQYGDTTAERAGTNLLNIDGLDLRDDLDGLAALMTACDLVVTVSNTTAHLAGALGVPTWVLVPAGAGKLWYWGQAGDSTPWYPSITIMRQAVQGQWQDVFSRVAARLATVADTLHR
jgi:ADP-heptose:LPS heptosyltransferase